jgi:hypothetical protein
MFLETKIRMFLKPPRGYVALAYAAKNRQGHSTVFGVFNP